MLAGSWPETGQVKGLFNFKTTQHHCRDFPAGRVQVATLPRKLIKYGKIEQDNKTIDKQLCGFDPKAFDLTIALIALIS